MGLQFGIFDHIEPVPDQALTQIYRERLHLLERYDAAGFYAVLPTISPSIIPRRSTVWPHHRMFSSPPPHSARASCAWHPASTSCRCITRCG